MLGAAFANVNVKYYDPTPKMFPPSIVQVNPVDLLTKVTTQTQTNLDGSLNSQETRSVFWSGQMYTWPKKELSSLFDPQALANLQPGMTYWAPPRQDFHELCNFSDLALSFRLTYRIELITSY